MGPAIIDLIRKSSRYNQPKQIAWAIVWGFICGLLPKSSLLFYVAAAASILMPMHLVVAALSIVVVSLFSPVVQPVFGNLGHWMLSSSGLASPIRSLDRFPLVPWLKLHNTVLIGTAIVSLAMALPAYWVISSIVAAVFDRWLPLFDSESQMQAQSQNAVATLSSSAQTTITAQLTETKYMAPRPPVVAPEVQPQPLAAALDRFDESMSSFTASQRRGSSQQVANSLANVIDSIHALEDLLEKANAEADQPVDARAVLARATQASELVDDILQSMDALSEYSPSPSESTIEIQSPSAEGHGPNHVRLDLPQVFQSHDTKISIYRRARTGELTITGSDLKTPSEKDSMPTATDAADQQSTLAVVTPTAKGISAKAPNAGQSGESNTIRKHDNQQHEEALRHLLNHLRALKEKV